MTEVPTPPAVPVPPAPAGADEAMWAVAKPLIEQSSFGRGIPGKLKRALQTWASAKGLT
jgi:hypothetical protein